MPPYAHNIFASYPAVLARLAQAPGVLQVEEILDFAARADKPRDGVVYVVFDGASPLSDIDQSREALYSIGFSAWLAQQHPRPDKSAYCETRIGETYTGLLRLLQGFDPTDEEGRALVASPYRPEKGPSPQYVDGFVLLPLRFTATVAVV